MADLVVSNGIGFKRRNPWGVFLLSIVTLSVYYFVWWYKINNEMNNLGVQCNPTSSVLAVTIGGLVIVPPFISYYTTADRIRQAQERTNASERIIPVLALLLFVVVNIFALPYYQSQLNKAWDAMVAAGAEVQPA
jgi:uncharacterized membrane protein YidH (DUF202 family)